MVRFEAGRQALADTGWRPVSVDGPDIDVRRLALDAVRPGNPMVALVEGCVAAPTRGHVHHGATSQDVVDSALMMVASAVLLQVESDLSCSPSGSRGWRARGAACRAWRAH